MHRQPFAFGVSKKPTLLPEGGMKKPGGKKTKEEGKKPSAPQKPTDMILKEGDVLKCKGRKLMMANVL